MSRECRWDSSRDLGGVERAAFALLGRGPAGVPHEVVGDELPAPLERVEQRDRPVRPGQREAGVDLDHGQPPPGRGDRVAFPGVRLLPHPQRVQLGLEGRPVGGRRRARCLGGAGRRRWVWRFIRHDGLLLVFRRQYVQPARVPTRDRMWPGTAVPGGRAGSGMGCCQAVASGSSPAHRPSAASGLSASVGGPVRIFTDASASGSASSRTAASSLRLGAGRSPTTRAQRAR